jgi:hypothetical protein
MDDYMLRSRECVPMTSRKLQTPPDSDPDQISDLVSLYFSEAPSTQPESTFPFLTLPRELRDRVYECMILNRLVDDVPDSETNPMESLPHLIFNRGILQTNHQIHGEFSRALCTLGQVHATLLEAPAHIWLGTAPAFGIQIPQHLHFFAPHLRSMVLEIHTIPSNLNVATQHVVPLAEREIRAITFLLNNMNAFPHLGELDIMLNLSDQDLTFSWVSDQLDRLKVLPCLSTITVTAFLAQRIRFQDMPEGISLPREVVRLRAVAPDPVEDQSRTGKCPVSSDYGDWKHAEHVWDAAEGGVWVGHGQKKRHECWRCLSDDPARQGKFDYFSLGYGQGFKIIW